MAPGVHELVKTFKHFHANDDPGVRSLGSECSKCAKCRQGKLERAVESIQMIEHEDEDVLLQREK